MDYSCEYTIKPGHPPGRVFYMVRGQYCCTIVMTGYDIAVGGPTILDRFNIVPMNDLDALPDPPTRESIEAIVAELVRRKRFDDAARVAVVNAIPCPPEASDRFRIAGALDPSSSGVFDEIAAWEAVMIPIDERLEWIECNIKPNVAAALYRAGFAPSDLDGRAPAAFGDMDLWNLLMAEEFGPVVATGLVAMARRGVPDVHVGSALYLAAESGDTDAIRALAYIVGMSCPSAPESDR